MNKSNYVWLSFWQVPVALLVGNFAFYGLEVSLNVSLFITFLVYMLMTYFIAAFSPWNT